MLDPEIERLKRMDLRAFLSKFYGLEFHREGRVDVAFSPFREEKKPSFYVRRCEDGHWVFKDHSWQSEGTVFDFVMEREGISFKEAKRHILRLVDGAGGEGLSSRRAPHTGDNSLWPSAGTEAADASFSPRYDIDGLYAQFRQTDPSPCATYLRQRGIEGALIDESIGRGVVVPNRREGRTYCCFAVHDAGGSLRCLSNHEIGGSDRFLLGRRHPFSLEWEELSKVDRVFLCESPIDYLSMKTLEGRDFPGMALLGSHVKFAPELVASVAIFVAAFDSDRAGIQATVELADRFPERSIEVYDLEGSKDPNELLCERLGRNRKKALSAREKLQLYREVTASSNKSEVARRWGLNRHYVYEVVRECEAAIVREFESRRPGRPRQDAKGTSEEPGQRFEELERKYLQERKEREEWMCRDERVWAEDFTELVVEGQRFLLALVIQVIYRKYLGWEIRTRATEALVARPLEMALEANGGEAPDVCILSDKGSVYTSDAHARELASAQIVHHLIPACRPDYNGEQESEMRMVKSLFYCKWEERCREGRPGPEELEAAIRETMAEVIRILNEDMPRPYLGGVTPNDAANGRTQEQAARMQAYRTEEEQREAEPWTRGYWDVVKAGASAETMSTQELQVKLAYFGLSPLRRIARLHKSA